MSSRPVVFLDFEASALDGWPIEVGLSGIVDGTVRTWSSLIRPRPEWSDELWSAAAEGIHGITRPMLLDAPPADQVAAEVRFRIKGRLLVSDAPEFDQRWLEWLTGERDDVALFDFLVFRTVDAKAVPRVFDHLSRLKTPHRAGPDSARLAKAWQHGIQISGTGSKRSPKP